MILKDIVVSQMKFVRWTLEALKDQADLTVDIRNSWLFEPVCMCCLVH